MMNIHIIKQKQKEFQEKKDNIEVLKSHSDLYTDENPKGTIHGLKFATVDDAKGIS